jgi:hypothetical protein
MPAHGRQALAGRHASATGQRHKASGRMRSATMAEQTAHDKSKLLIKSPPKLPLTVVRSLRPPLRVRLGCIGGVVTGTPKGTFARGSPLGARRGEARVRIGWAPLEVANLHELFVGGCRVRSYDVVSWRKGRSRNRKPATSGRRACSGTDSPYARPCSRLSCG